MRRTFWLEDWSRHDLSGAQDSACPIGHSGEGPCYHVTGHHENAT